MSDVFTVAQSLASFSGASVVSLIVHLYHKANSENITDMMMSIFNRISVSQFAN